MAGETKLKALRKQFANKSTEELKALMDEKRKLSAHYIANARPKDLSGVTDEAFKNKTDAEKREQYEDLNFELAAIRAELKPRLDDEAYKKAVVDRAVSGDMSPAKNAHDGNALEEIKNALKSAIGRGVEAAIKRPGDFLKAAIDDNRIVINPDDQRSHRPQSFRVGATAEERFGIMNATFLQTAGWSPETLRSGRIVFEPQVRQDLLDIIPMTPVSTRQYKWMRETGYTPPTDANFARAEGAQAEEATLTYAETSTDLAISSVRLPISEESLRDEPMIMGIVNGRMMHMLRQRLGKELAVGPGSANRIKGFEGFLAATQTDGTAFPNTDTDAAATRRLGTAGTNIPVLRPADADGTDGTPYTTSAQESIISIMRAAERIERDGGGMVSHVALSGPSWVALTTARDDDDRFIMPQMMGAGNMNMFPGLGVPMVRERNLTSGRALVGDFRTGCTHAANGGITVTLGFDGQDFSSRRRTILANSDSALVVFQTRMFCFVGGIVT